MDIDDIEHVIKNLMITPKTHKITDMINHIGRGAMQWYVYLLLFVGVMILLFFVPILIDMEIFSWCMKERKNEHIIKKNKIKKNYIKKSKDNRL